MGAAGEGTSAEETARTSAAARAARYSMNFQGADAGSVVQFLSMVSGIPVVTDPDLKGNVTIISPKPMTLGEVYDVINAALRVRGFTMVGDLNSKVIQVESLKKAIADGTTVVSGTDLSNVNAGQDLITQVVPLQYRELG